MKNGDIVKLNSTIKDTITNKIYPTGTVARLVDVREDEYVMLVTEDKKELSVEKSLLDIVSHHLN